MGESRKCPDMLSGRMERVPRSGAQAKRTGPRRTRSRLASGECGTRSPGPRRLPAQLSRPAAFKGPGAPGSAAAAPAPPRLRPFPELRGGAGAEAAERTIAEAVRFAGLLAARGSRRSAQDCGSGAQTLKIQPPSRARGRPLVRHSASLLTPQQPAGVTRPVGELEMSYELAREEEKVRSAGCFCNNGRDRFL